MASFKADSEVVSNEMVGRSESLSSIGKSGHLPVGPGEAKVACPSCGSPYIATFGPTESRYAKDLDVTITDVRKLTDKYGKAKPYVMTIERGVPGLECSAGDCGYHGPAARRAA